jgi:branched-chain amino acid transport system ATP-binding protein
MSIDLTTENLTKRFGGLTAVNTTNLRVAAGSIHGIIGPNGAGKTSLFNLIAGSYRPTEGRVLLGGRDITNLPPEGRCQRGLARTFQVPRPFAGLDVLDNVAVGCLARAHSVAHARDLALPVLDLLGIVSHADALAETLPIGLRKLLEVARALATAPKLLLLDEVMGGLHGEEVDRMIATVARINQSGVTIVMIEHVLPAIIALASTVTVLDQGSIIASGPPSVVTRDPAVIAAYLGDEVLA